MLALVLLPGLDGTGRLFADFVAALGLEVEVIVASYPTDTPLGYAELAEVAHSFLPPGKPFFLLAESFSGPIAISIAQSAPPGLLGVVLCCSFARNPLPVLALGRPLLGIVPVGALPVALLSFFVLGRFSSPALRAALASALATVAPAVLRARARAVLSVDVSALLAGVRVPLLYLRAVEDRLVPRSSAELLVCLAPDTQLVEFAAPHFLLQALPSEAAAAVIDFMKRHRGLEHSNSHSTGCSAMTPLGTAESKSWGR